MAMAVAQKTKTDTWSEVFPAVISEQSQSVAFCKKLMAIGVSVVLYLRGDLDDECFTVKQVNGVKVTLLRTKAGNKLVDEICALTKSAAKALEQGYLKEMHVLLSPYEDKPDVLECYKFQFDKIAANSAKSMAVAKDCNTKDFQHQTRQMLKNLMIAAQSCETLPPEAFISLRLVYDTDVIIPSSMLPEGFTNCTSEDMKTKFFKSPAKKLTLGSVESIWHRAGMEMQSCGFEGPHIPGSQSGADNPEEEPVPVAVLSEGLEPAELSPEDTRLDTSSFAFSKMSKENDKIMQKTGIKRSHADSQGDHIRRSPRLGARSKKQKI